MPIISISLNEKILKQMDELQKELGFSGRSEIIRTGLRMLIEDKKEKAKLKGVIDSVLLVMHDDIHTEEISIISHRYQKLIKTQLHNQLIDEKCLEIFILSGEADKILALFKAFQANKKTDLVKLFVS